MPDAGRASSERRDTWTSLPSLLCRRNGTSASVTPVVAPLSAAAPRPRLRELSTDTEDTREGCDSATL
jgi:hypothetical protein